MNDFNSIFTLDLTAISFPCGYFSDDFMLFSKNKSLEYIPSMEYILVMWEIEYTDEFEEWWDTLSLEEQKAVGHSVVLLQNDGPALPFPYSSSVKSSKQSKMRELRSQCGGDALRTFYAFDPRRLAILLIGGNKTGNDRFYEEYVPIADKIYDQYLKERGGEVN